MSEPQAESDEVLVESARIAPEGDMRAFETLIGRHQDAVVTNCRCLTRSPDDAQDLAQEVFVKAFFGLSSFEGRAPFRAWIQRIKVNHCLNFLRKQKQASHVDIDDEALVGEPELHVASQAESSVEAASDRAVIQEVLDSMPETLRVALILRDLDGMPYAEIAQKLGTGLSATKMRIKRAREEFRERYRARSGQAESAPHADAQRG